MKAEGAKFDFDKTLKAFMEGRPLTGENGPLKPLIKRLTEAALEAELDAHLAKRHGPQQGEATFTFNGGRYAPGQEAWPQQEKRQNRQIAQDQRGAH